MNIKILFYLSSLVFVNHVYAAENLLVHYDKKEQVLSVKAEQVLLSRLLAGISEATGLAMHVKAGTDRTLSIVVDRKPLEQAMKDILCDINHIAYYGSDKGEAKKLVGLDILPAGKVDSAFLDSPTPTAMPGTTLLDTPERRQRRAKYEQITRAKAERKQRRIAARRRAEAGN